MISLQNFFIIRNHLPIMLCNPKFCHFVWFLLCPAVFVPFILMLLTILCWLWELPNVTGSKVTKKTNNVNAILNQGLGSKHLEHGYSTLNHVGIICSQKNTGSECNKSFLTRLVLTPCWAACGATGNCSKRTYTRQLLYRIIVIIH